ncbi:hypothetical protein T265_00249 [Opisthorchis viverrini]|uniref:Uncharacterized protein n=1 Tax=Opisthorchis viverrini TaxID=6198 RepID=A0A075A6S5_OPIVI|nr:hypothetical protein T265_00249 [Opisthorchis viverrini]KER34072.1 hypothetical protein T265_00249 [Opisthorchis viverrini]
MCYTQAASCFIWHDIRDIAVYSHRNIRLTETRGLRLSDGPQEGRNRSWAVEEFSATLYRDELFRRNTLLTRLLNILRQHTAGFVLLGVHRVGEVFEFSSNLLSA